MTNDMTPTLSKRELQILQLLAEGQTSKQIASVLDITELTVQTHRRNMLRKMKLKNAQQMVSWGFQNGILSY